MKRMIILARDAHAAGGVQIVTNRPEVFQHLTPCTLSHAKTHKIRFETDYWWAHPRELGKDRMLWVFPTLEADTVFDREEMITSVETYDDYERVYGTRPQEVYDLSRTPDVLQYRPTAQQLRFQPGRPMSDDYLFITNRPTALAGLTSGSRTRYVMTLLHRQNGNRLNIGVYVETTDSQKIIWRERARSERTGRTLESEYIPLGVYLETNGLYHTFGDQARSRSPLNAKRLMLIMALSGGLR